MTKYFILRAAYDRLLDGGSNTLKLFSDNYDSSQIQEYSSKDVTKVEGYKIELDETIYELHYRNVEAERITHRRPHPTVRREWDDDVKRIKETINEQERILARYVDEDLKGIKTNLFVNPNYAEVVLTKIDELRKILAGLTLRVDKLKDHYETVKDEEGQPGVIKEKAPVSNAN
jgi:hypothetical protein